MFKKKEQTKFEDAKICILTSSGGHLTHMMLLNTIQTVSKTREFFENDIKLCFMPVVVLSGRGAESL